MSQVLILLLYVLWVAAAGERLPQAEVDWLRLVAIFGGFLLIVLIPAAVARWQTRLAFPAGAWTLQRRFGWLLTVCRFSIVVWFALAVFGTDAWRNAVGQILGPIAAMPLALPGMLLGPLPAIAAWAGLSWAQYPIDHFAREQSVLPLLESNLPVHAPPSLASFVATHFRLQVLATVVPLLMIGLLHDVAT
ncbi:MAG: hypothetical protein NZ561_02480, partial [Phycisphaerae bacterium]|nr:hypothetical protein [Phycisphaerae bacterium]MDW8262221.1 hypothetical protein [Phycisphaerales bacterium]